MIAGAPSATAAPMMKRRREVIEVTFRLQIGPGLQGLRRDPMNANTMPANPRTGLRSTALQTVDLREEQILPRARLLLDAAGSEHEFRERDDVLRRGGE